MSVNDLDAGSTASTALTRLGGLIDQILAAMPSGQLIFSSIIGVRQGSTHPVTPQQISAYNGGIPSIVNSRASAGKNISFLDTYNLAALDTSITSADYGSDGFHPSLQGYSKIADAWYTALGPLLAH